MHLVLPPIAWYAGPIDLRMGPDVYLPKWASWSSRLETQDGRLGKAQFYPDGTIRLKLPSQATKHSPGLSPGRYAQVGPRDQAAARRLPAVSRAGKDVGDTEMFAVDPRKVRSTPPDMHCQTSWAVPKKPLIARSGTNTASQARCLRSMYFVNSNKAVLIAACTSYR